MATLEKIADGLGIPFHLFTLLASEAEDLRDISPEDMTQLATSLSKLLLRGNVDEPDRGSGRIHSKAEHPKPERPSSQTRNKRRKAA